MRVICIEDNWGATNILVPKCGDVYIVIECGKCGCGVCGRDVYYLKEMNHNIGWQQQYFIPLSNIDERELLKERYGVEAENEFI